MHAIEFNEAYDESVRFFTILSIYKMGSIHHLEETEVTTFIVNCYNAAGD